MRKIYLLCLLTLLLCSGEHLYAQEEVEQWDIFELSMEGSQEGNPFVGVQLSAIFSQQNQQTGTFKIYEPEGFYDGNGIYKVRFMPDATGAWTYETKSNKEELNGIKGEFVCTPPTTNNHGPVRVRNDYHFAYADGTPYYPFGTTIYEWPFQPEARRKETIATLQQTPFNKARFLAVPPASDRYEEGSYALENFPFEGSPQEDWDFSRFNPEYFRQLEACVEQLNDIGVQADFILFRPYDKGRWGFDTMDELTNERFLRYVIARFAAYRNIWWSLANENSFIKHLSDEDWDHLFQIVEARDPYHHLRSIHNAGRIYDYNKPWVSHVSLQYYNAVRAFGVSPLLRDIYRKPIIHDEINYEGNIEKRWGQLSAEEMTHRFWIALIGGSYATHGEAIEGGWLSYGGKLEGKSPERIAFLRQIVEEGPEGGLEPIDQYYLTNMAGKNGEYYLIYFGEEALKQWDFELPRGVEEGMRFQVDLIDTWNMKITPLDRVFETERLDHYTFVDKKKGKVKLPGKPYMAIRIQKIEDQ